MWSYLRWREEGFFLDAWGEGDFFCCLCACFHRGIMRMMTVNKAWGAKHVSFLSEEIRFLVVTHYKVVVSMPLLLHLLMQSGPLYHHSYSCNTRRHGSVDRDRVCLKELPWRRLSMLVRCCSRVG